MCETHLAVGLMTGGFRTACKLPFVGNNRAGGEPSARRNAPRFERPSVLQIFRTGWHDVGPIIALARSLAATREEEQMYYGGGLVGVVVVVLVVLFLMGRI